MHAMTITDSAPDAQEGFLYFAFSAWVIALAAFAWVELQFAPLFVPVYESLEVSLPGALLFCLDLSDWLLSPIGSALGLAVVAASIWPFARGRRGHLLGKRYLRSAIALSAVTMMAFCVVALPAFKLQEALAENDGTHSSPPGSPR